jgi:predicted ester cyclase
LVKTARALFDAMTAHDLSAWERLLADEFVADYPCAPKLDRAAARAYNEPFVAAFPDLEMTAERVVVQGDTVVLDGYASGTFSKPLATPNGVLKPTGKHGGIRIVLIAQIENGKIVREQTVWNQLDLFTQLGIIPASTAA